MNRGPRNEAGNVVRANKSYSLQNENEGAEQRWYRGYRMLFDKIQHLSSIKSLGELGWERYSPKPQRRLSIVKRNILQEMSHRTVKKQIPLNINPLPSQTINGWERKRQHCHSLQMSSACKHSAKEISDKWSQDIYCYKENQITKIDHIFEWTSRNM